MNEMSAELFNTNRESTETPTVEDDELTANAPVIADARKTKKQRRKAKEEKLKVGLRGFFLGDGRSPYTAKMLPIPPIRHLSPFLDKGLSPPPAKVHPRKFEKFKYIFVSNLTTFKGVLQSAPLTPKSSKISMFCALSQN